MAGLILMCGLAFSGKSTAARFIAETLNCDYQSLDDINDERGLWGGYGLPVEEWQRTHDIARTRVHECLTSGMSVVLDDTSNLRLLRDGYRDLAAGCKASFALVHVQALPQEIEARMSRAAAVGDRRPVEASVYADHVAQFEEPEADEAAITHRSGEPMDALVDQLHLRLCP